MVEFPCSLRAIWIFEGSDGYRVKGRALNQVETDFAARYGQPGKARHNLLVSACYTDRTTPCRRVVPRKDDKLDVILSRLGAPTHTRARYVAGLRPSFKWDFTPYQVRTRVPHDTRLTTWNENEAVYVT